MNKVLQLISENARLTNEEIAVMLSMTEEEVENEIDRLTSEGIIKGYRTLINWERSGELRATALIDLKVQPKKEFGFDDIARRLNQMPEVESVYLMSGGYDISLTVKGRTMQDIAMFVVKRLSPMDGIISTTTHFVLNRYKDGNVIFDNGERPDERRSNLL